MARQRQLALARGFDAIPDADGLVEAHVLEDVLTKAGIHAKLHLAHLEGLYRVSNVEIWSKERRLMRADQNGRCWFMILFASSYFGLKVHGMPTPLLYIVRTVILEAFKVVMANATYSSRLHALAAKVIV